MGAGVVVGGGAGLVVGGAMGAVGGYASTGTWAGAWAGAQEGMLAGAFAGALGGAIAGWKNPFVCFAAGTEVVIAVRVRNKDGTIRTVTAAELAAQGHGALATLKIVGFVTVPIETLRAGDWVLTRDENSPDAPLVLKQIEEVFENTAYQLQLVTLRSSGGVEHTIPTTAQHPVYRIGSGWVAAETFNPGDLVNDLGGASTVLASRIENHPEGVQVYNFRVRDGHTYFVREKGSTAEPVWVHNSCTTDELRNTPGTATQSGSLARVGGRWLRAGTPAAIPAQVAGKLVGRVFKSIGELRAAIYTEIAGNPELNSGFTKSNVSLMSNGRAPFAPPQFQTGEGYAQMKFNLHHIDSLVNGGNVYDLSNLQIVSPLIHDGLH